MWLRCRLTWLLSWKRQEVISERPDCTSSRWCPSQRRSRFAGDLDLAGNVNVNVNVNAAVNVKFSQPNLLVLVVVVVVAVVVGVAGGLRDKHALTMETAASRLGGSRSLARRLEQI